jgi:uncharacterized protein YbdZ (MbtH family)
MFHEDEDDTTTYRVVVNHEEQYSIWPEHRESPLGWSDAGKVGLKAECLEFIREVWTDMRPLSLRRHMEEMARKKAAGELDTEEDTEPEEWNQGPSLVERLCAGWHEVEISLRPERTVPALQKCIERGYVHVRFVNTRGGTELGVRLNPEACEFGHADFDKRSGAIRIEGDLTLDYVKVRCVADIELATLAGQGHLVALKETSDTG